MRHAVHIPARTNKGVGQEVKGQRAEPECSASTDECAAVQVAAMLFSARPGNTAKSHLVAFRRYKYHRLIGFPQAQAHARAELENGRRLSHEELISVRAPHTVDRTVVPIILQFYVPFFCY